MRTFREAIQASRGIGCDLPVNHFVHRDWCWQLMSFWCNYWIANSIPLNIISWPYCHDINFIQVIKSEIKYSHLDCPSLEPKHSPLDWWKLYEANFPRLSKLARKILCTPADHLYSPRLFSELGKIYDERRSRQQPTTDEKLLTYINIEWLVWHEQ